MILGLWFLLASYIVIVVLAETIVKCDESTQFDCGGGNCIGLELVCDGKAHCPEGEDEPNNKCNVNECLVNNGNCSHICVDTAISFHCDCRPGYQLSLDDKSCEGLINNKP